MTTVDEKQGIKRYTIVNQKMTRGCDTNQYRTKEQASGDTLIDGNQSVCSWNSPQFYNKKALSKCLLDSTDGLHSEYFVSDAQPNDSCLQDKAGEDFVQVDSKGLSVLKPTEAKFANMNTNIVASSIANTNQFFYRRTNFPAQNRRACCLGAGNFQQGSMGNVGSVLDNDAQQKKNKQKRDKVHHDLGIVQTSLINLPGFRPAGAPCNSQNFSHKGDDCLSHTWDGKETMVGCALTKGNAGICQSRGATLLEPEETNNTPGGITRSSYNSLGNEWWPNPANRRSLPDDPQPKVCAPFWTPGVPKGYDDATQAVGGDNDAYTIDADKIWTNGGNHHGGCADVFLTGTDPWCKDPATLRTVRLIDLYMYQDGEKGGNLCHQDTLREGETLDTVAVTDGYGCKEDWKYFPAETSTYSTSVPCGDNCPSNCKDDTGFFCIGFLGGSRKCSNCTNHEDARTEYNRNRTMLSGTFIGEGGKEQCLTYCPEQHGVTCTWDTTEQIKNKANKYGQRRCFLMKKDGKSTTCTPEKREGSAIVYVNSIVEKCDEGANVKRVPGRTINAYKDHDVDQRWQVFADETESNDGTLYDQNDLASIPLNGIAVQDATYCREWYKGNYADASSQKGGYLKTKVCDTKAIDEVVTMCNTRYVHGEPIMKGNTTASAACMPGKNGQDPMAHCPGWKLKGDRGKFCQDIAKAYPLLADMAKHRYCDENPLDETCDCLKGEVVASNITDDVCAPAKDSTTAKNLSIRQPFCQKMNSLDDPAIASLKTIRNRWYPACKNLNAYDYTLKPQHIIEASKDTYICDQSMDTIKDVCLIDAFRDKNNEYNNVCSVAEGPDTVCANIIDFHGQNCIVSGGENATACNYLENIRMENNCPSSKSLCGTDEVLTFDQAFMDKIPENAIDAIRCTKQTDCVQKGKTMGKNVKQSLCVSDPTYGKICKFYTCEMNKQIIADKENDAKQQKIAEEDKKKAEQKAQDEEKARQKAAEDEEKARQKAAEDKKKAEQKAAEDKKKAEQKAAEDEKKAEQKAEEKARQKAAEDEEKARQKAAEDEEKAEQEKPACSACPKGHVRCTDSECCCKKQPVLCYIPLLNIYPLASHQCAKPLTFLNVFHVW